MVITNILLTCWRILTLYPLSRFSSTSDTQFYPMDTLAGPAPYPDGVDPAMRELHLSDEEFKEVVMSERL
jgi:hypothetical protein